MRAQYNVGWMNAYGIGTLQDYEEAINWYRKSADQGFVHAQFNLGNMYLRGDGVDKDDALAHFNLESKDYYTLTKRILTLAKELCDGKVVSILEGGYDLNALKESVDYHVKSLLE